MARRHRGPRARRSARAARAAYVGGFLLFATGSTGAVATVELGRRLVDDLAAAAGRFLEPLFLAANAVAALGGLSVMVGAYLLPRRRWLGKVLVALGSGVGLLTFLVQLVGLVAAGKDPTTMVLRLALTVQGFGVLLVLYAQARG